MSEQEIDISGATGEQARFDQPQSGPRHTFDSNKPDFSNNASGIESPSELLDRLLEKSEEDFIPWEEVTLPSGGLYYDGKIPNGIIRIRAMGVAAEKILATPRLAQTGQAMDYLFEHCIKFPDPEFKPGDMLAGDRVFVLYVIRGITHGNIYEFALKCPVCSAQFTSQYDLNDLAGTIRGGNHSLGDEPFKVVLPYMSEVAGREVWVRVRLLRSSDVSKVTNRKKFQKRARAAVGSKTTEEMVDESLTENLNLIIVDFMGEESNPSKMRMLVERMHSRDTATIREFLRNNSPGIDTNIIVECPECGKEVQTELPITESFFRPTESRTVRE